MLSIFIDHLRCKRSNPRGIYKSELKVAELEILILDLFRRTTS